MQSAGPIRQPWQPITFEFLFKGSEFDIGKSKADKMHLRSDILALAKLKSSASWPAMRTITKLAPLVRAG